MMSRLTDFQRVLLMNALNGVGMGLVGIFIPVFLLELGYSFETVVIWLIVHHATLLAATFLVAFTANYIGLVRCWYIRILFVAILFGGLSLLPMYPLLLFILAVMSGLEAAFFWMPYNVFMVRKTEENSMGASFALMQNASAVVGIVTPGIAALIIVSYGYVVLFGLAAIFIALSLLPVLAFGGERTDFHFNFRAMRETVRTNKQFILPEIFDNLGQDAGVIWMLFIFMSGLTILDIGALGVVTGIIGILVTFITGKLTDQWNVHSVMRVGAIGTTVLWVASYIIALYDPSPLMLYVVTALRGFALGVFITSYGTLMYNRARQSDVQFLVLREIPTVGGRIVLFLGTLYCISIGQTEFVFLLVAVLSLYFWFNNIEKLRSHE